MSTSKLAAFTLPEEQEVPEAPLQTVARFDGVALAEELREGVELLLAARGDDPAFLRQVRESFETACELLGEVDGAETVIEALRPSTVLRAAEVPVSATVAESTTGQPQRRRRRSRASVSRRAQSS